VNNIKKLLKDVCYTSSRNCHGSVKTGQLDVDTLARLPTHTSPLC